MRTTIEGDDNGRQLLHILRGRLGISNSLLTRLKRREDGILVNGKRVTVRYIVSRGDILELSDADGEGNEKIIPSDAAVEILFEDPDAVVFNKPAHMPTHPSHGHFSDTLANAAAGMYGAGFVFRPVNRLDRDTSGAVLVAKNQRAAAFLSSALAEGKFEKTYIAAVDGRLEGDGVIEIPIRRAKESIINREVCAKGAPGGQYARTEYSVLCAADSRTLVRVTPKTGRTHQIRVHFAAIGHPVTADGLYGTESPFIDRQALHAYSLRLPLPRGGEADVTAPLPPDFRKLLERSGIDYEIQEAKI